MLSPAAAALESIYKSIGVFIYPLRSFEQIARFFLSAAAVAAGTPRRAILVAERLGVELASEDYGVGMLLGRIASSPSAQRLIRLLPASEGMALITDRVDCAVCGCRESLVQRDRPEHHSTQATLYGEHGEVKTVTIHQKVCTNCNAVHYLSYATGGCMEPGEQQFYEDKQEARFFHVTPSAVFETCLLVGFEAQAVYSHTGFLTFVQEYQMKHGQAQVSVAWFRKLFAHVFYAWSLLRWRTEMKLPLKPMKLGDSAARNGEGSLSVLDETILQQMPELQTGFTAHWGKRHEDVCRQPGNCVSHSGDGHCKARRDVCKNRYARIINRGPLGYLAMNCTRAPARGSLFCVDCRAAAAVGPAGLVGASGTSKDAALCEPCEPPESDMARTSWKAARGWEVSAKEENVYLVESLLEKKKATLSQPTSCSFGAEKHANDCVRKKKRWIYRVKWVGYEDDSWWVCECDIGKEAIDEFKAERARPKKHAGKLAAEINAKLCGDGKSDFVVTARDEAAFRTLACETLKEFQHEERKHTTAGVLALVSSCGLFLKISEIFGSESMTQVHNFLFEAYSVDKIQKPKVFAYDDACHLKKFLLNRQATSPLARFLLKDMEIVCDRFHFPNHKSLWCKANVNPANCKIPGFERANTEAAEQAFAWLAGAKASVRHMNEARFLFFVLRLSHLRNVELCKSASKERESEDE